MSSDPLIYSGDMLDNDTGNFHQFTHEEVMRISSHLLFFILELNTISDADLKEKLKSREFNHYYPWLRDLRVFQPHQLDDQVEKPFLEKNIRGRAAWTSTF
jgi:Oligoendopeptidase F